MDKVELQNDMKFRYVCSDFATNHWNYNFDIYDNVIKLNSDKKGIYVLIDENYNVIGVYGNELSLEHQTEEELSDKIKKIYEKYSSSFPSVLGNFSLKDIQGLSKRIDILSSNRGHSTDMMINCQEIDRTDEDDNAEFCFYLLSYISFIGNYLKEYFKEAFHMKALGFEYPDVYTYLDHLISNIEDGIKNIDRFPVCDIAFSIGMTGREFLDRYSNALYQIINYYYFNRENVDISEFDILKILEVPNEVVEQRIEGMRKFVHPGEVKILDIVKPNGNKKYVKKKANE